MYPDISAKAYVWPGRRVGGKHAPRLHPYSPLPTPAHPKIDSGRNCRLLHFLRLNMNSQSPASSTIGHPIIKKPKPSRKVYWRPCNVDFPLPELSIDVGPDNTPASFWLTFPVNFMIADAVHFSGGSSTFV
eukprot:scaffold195499_cov31-Tisochrysis_lutea.AAC.1